MVDWDDWARKISEAGKWIFGGVSAAIAFILANNLELIFALIGLLLTTIALAAIFKMLGYTTPRREVDVSEDSVAEIAEAVRSELESDNQFDSRSPENQIEELETEFED